MIRKAAQSKPRRPATRRRQAEPLEVDLTVSFRFGSEPEDRITPIDGRRLPMVNSVFQNRDRILRAFVGLMFKAGLSSPRVVGHLLPAAGAKRRGA
ncbi:hypothetical protein [Sinimarinibacterium flocculans]|uniref:Uncharacterized protein n=1 Tax=Sinimarinibacterium flocculans TaxID=985250 RepID=A0A318EE65_9GAMM|nr:hypothetical protein [Sinimarinibacterium flocculans]PXV68479.1 hypothetical protein C8D93_104177 [Sinimarinibacterium flocculans]